MPETENVEAATGQAFMLGQYLTSQKSKFWARQSV